MPLAARKEGGDETCRPRRFSVPSCFQLTHYARATEPDYLRAVLYSSDLILARRTACAAANLATGTRYGEQLT